MPRKKKAQRPRSVSIKLSSDEEKKLKEWSRAYPDGPCLGETAHRLLQRELGKGQARLTPAGSLAIGNLSVLLGTAAPARR